MNFNGALILWGENTRQNDIRDLGVYMHAAETAGLSATIIDLFLQFSNKLSSNIGLIWMAPISQMTFYCLMRPYCGMMGRHMPFFGARK